MDEHDDRALPPEQQKVRDRIRGLRPVAADPAFRDQLQERFASGRLVPSARASRPRSALARRIGWIAIPAAAAAVIALVFFLNRGGGLEIQPISEHGTIRVAGRSVNVTQTAALVRALRPGRSIETDADAQLDMLAGGMLLVEVTPSTDMTVPETGRRGGRTAFSFHVTGGEVRLMTGPRFAGASLEVTTPQGVIEVTGTTVSVDCDDTGTCVCVMHGTAMVGTGPNDMQPVPSGMRKVMPSNGAAAYITRIEPTHLAGILDFEARHPEMHPAGAPDGS